MRLDSIPHHPSLVRIILLFRFLSLQFKPTFYTFPFPGCGIIPMGCLTTAYTFGVDVFVTWSFTSKSWVRPCSPYRCVYILCVI